MVFRVDEGGLNEEKGDTLFGFCYGYRILWRFVGRGIISDISEGNAQILGGNENKKYLLHIMVTLKGKLKGETGEKWHMLPLVDTMESEIEVEKWVGKLLEVLVDEDGRLEGWVFHREGG